MKLFDASLDLLQKSLDLRLERQNLLAGDIANSDTPNFDPKDIDFTKAMSDAMSGAPSGPAPIIEGFAGPAGFDGNKVDLDRTMTALAENGLGYSADAHAVSKKLAILKYVASDGAT